MNAKERVTIDCRDHPESNCTMTFSGAENEVLDIVEYHATAKHGYKKEPGLRDKLRSMMKREAFAR